MHAFGLVELGGHDAITVHMLVDWFMGWWFDTTFCKFGFLLLCHRALSCCLLCELLELILSKDGCLVAVLQQILLLMVALTAIQLWIHFR